MVGVAGHLDDGVFAHDALDQVQPVTAAAEQRVLRVLGVGPPGGATLAVGGEPVVHVVDVDAAEVEHVADLALAGGHHHRPPRMAVAHRVVDHDDTVGLGFGGADRPRLVGRRAHGLLDHHMAAGLEGLDRVLGVQPVRAAVADHVRLDLRQQGVKAVAVDDLSAGELLGQFRPPLGRGLHERHRLGSAVVDHPISHRRPRHPSANNQSSQRRHRNRPFKRTRNTSESRAAGTPSSK